LISADLNQWSKNGNPGSWLQSACAGREIPKPAQRRKKGRLEVSVLPQEMPHKAAAKKAAGVLCAGRRGQEPAKNLDCEPVIGSSPCHESTPVGQKKAIQTVRRSCGGTCQKIPEEETPSASQAHSRGEPAARETIATSRRQHAAEFFVACNQFLYRQGTVV